MTLLEVAALLRRHVFAVLAVVIVTAGLAYTFKHAAATYSEGGTMVFVPPETGPAPNPLEGVGGTVAESLAESAGAVASQIMSPAGQQEVRQAGGTAGFNVQLLNSYDLEYPNYSNPYLVLNTTSGDPVAAHQTFTALDKVIASDFTAEQVRDNVVPANRIPVVLTGDTGPLAEQGSSKRALGALVLLAAVVALAVASFLDRHPVRPRRVPRRITPRPRPRPAPARFTGIRPADPARPDY